jgi:glycosyltransferase involved in cell wall biosynthesis
MTVAVVVPCRNEATTIERLLDGIAVQTRPPDEVIIVDDRSTDSTAAVVNAWTAANHARRIKIISGTGRGVAAAMNTGISSATSATIVRFDGHSVPQADYIERALTTLADAGRGIVGGVWVIEPGDDSPTARAIAAVVSHPLGSGGARYRTASTRTGNGPVAVETVPFGVYPRRLWEELGGFDESLIANEDFDFCFRARRAGAAVVLDSRIGSIYRARPTLRQLARQYHRYGFWKAQMLRKDASAWHWRQGPPVAVIPWLLITAAWAIGRPSVASVGALFLYPVCVVAGAAQIAVGRRDSRLLPAAAAAFFTAHLSWSSGFWRALAGARPPR